MKEKMLEIRATREKRKEEKGKKAGRRCKTSACFLSHPKGE